MGRRSAGWAVTAAGLAVLLAGCGGPTAAPAKAPSSTSRPPTSTTRDAFSEHEVLFALKAKYGVSYPLGDACPDGVAYDDPACGQQLTQLNQIGQALVQAVSDLDPKAPNLAKLRESANTLNGSFNDVQGLGCYGLGSQPPKQSKDRLQSLCPEFGKLTMLMYLDLESQTDNN